jgi:hypothetical protein
MATRVQIQRRRRRAHALAREGYSAREIGKRLGVSKSTAAADLAAEEPGPATEIVAPEMAGNDRAVSHGLYAKLTLQPRADELAGWLREIVPAAAATDEPAIRVAAMVFAQVERGAEYVAEHGWIDEAGEPRALMRALPTLQAEARRWCEVLGLTPAARAKLGLDLVKGKDLEQYVREKYGGDGK